MLIRTIQGFVLTASLASAFAQTANDQPAFEVASVKPSPAGPVRYMGGKGGPGSNDPGAYHCENCTIPMMVADAYNVRDFQIDCPHWMESERFEINAKVPAGTTKEQFRVMKQNLLAERFQLKLRHETRDLPQYELTVAKGGPKFKESEPPKKDTEQSKQEGNPFPKGGPKTDTEGFPILPVGRGTMMTMMGDGHARMVSEHQTMKQFIGTLSYQLHQPLIDSTGLAGKYDFALSWMWRTADTKGAAAVSANGSIADTADMDAAGWTLTSAVQSQLGLKLVEKKAPMDVLVIEHAEKVPTEN
jgi:uncharacterized protein (TIGR03435 family)